MRNLLFLLLGSLLLRFSYGIIEDNYAAQLVSRGITGLCHPDSAIAGFPKCDFSNDKRRKLQEDTYDDDENMGPSHLSKLLHMIGAFVCVVLAALASGLTIGLLSLDPLLLMIKIRAGANEKCDAEKILPVIQRHHLLLVTLLLLNTIAGEALPMFLHGLVPELVAVLISVVLVLFFGEILPAALFTGTNQLQLAAQWAQSVQVLMWIFFPIAYPISKLLDWVVGRGEVEPNASKYNRAELAALIRIQYEERMVAKKQHKREIGMDADAFMYSSTRDLRKGLMETSPRDLRRGHHRRDSSNLHCDEVLIAEGALQMKNKRAIDLVLSHRKVFSIALDTILDEANVVKIFGSGFSRVPVYDKIKTHIKGILMTRQLIMVKGNDCPVSQLNLHIPQCVGPDTNLVELVNLFQGNTLALTAHRGSHMALVCAKPEIGNAALDHDQVLPDEAGYIGIITLEDVLEALLQEQIYDEMDQAGRLSTREAPSNDTSENDSGHFELL